MQGHHLLVQGQSRGAPVVAQVKPSSKNRSTRQPLPAHLDATDLDLLRGLTQLWPKPMPHPLDVIAEVAQQVSAICYLMRRRQRFSNHFHVYTVCRATPPAIADSAIVLPASNIRPTRNRFFAASLNLFCTMTAVSSNCPEDITHESSIDCHHWLRCCDVE